MLPVDQLSCTASALPAKAHVDALLNRLCPSWQMAYQNSANPLPMRITQSHLEGMHKLQLALARALVAVVTQYPQSARLREALPLPAEVLQLLEGPFMRGDYALGHYRPDFVFDAAGDFWVCEINARFPLNGYLATTLGNQVWRDPAMLAHVGGKISGVDAEKVPNPGKGIHVVSVENGQHAHVESQREFTLIPGLDHVVGNILSRFDPSRPIGILKRREKGYDVNILGSLLAAHVVQNSGCVFVDPAQLILAEDGQSVVAETREKGPVSQWINELHQDEILSLPGEIARVLFDPAKTVILNDLRTIFLVHDKRMLAVLTNGDLMRGLISLEDLEVIKSHVLPTFVVGQLDPGVRVALAKDEWVLKPSLLGKGEGIVFGKNVTEEAWLAALARNEGFVLQRFIRQPKLAISSVQGAKEGAPRLVCEENCVVGTLLCSDHTFLGPGIYRASPTSDIVAISRGGTFLFPVLQPGGQAPSPDRPEYCRGQFYHKFLPKDTPAFPIPEDACFAVSSLDDLSGVPDYHGSLLRHGVALVYVRPGDPDSLFMTAVVNALGQPNPHSKTVDTLWDVKYDPKQSGTSCARSVSTAEFPFHTDCSFETPPPRFFALDVIHADRYGGGLTELVDGEMILAQMTPEEIHALQSSRYRLEVPQEFNKGVPFIEGPLLSRERCFRFREDIITPPEDAVAQAALQHLKELLASRVHAGYLLLPQNTLILVDNGRFFHGRSKLKDHARHLRRIRFHPKDNSLIPNFL